MAVCKFFMQGSCRFGDKCRNEHPGGQPSNRNNYSAPSYEPRDDRGSNQRGRGRGRGDAASFGNHQVRFDGGGRDQSGFDQGGRGFNQGGRGDPNQQGAFNQPNNFDNRGSGQGRGRGRDTYQPPSGPRWGGGRGGFQGRNQNRQNDVTGPRDNYMITPQEIVNDVTTEKPQWVCSAYAPGRDAPTQLIDGSDLEISPEELRYDFYLTVANGQNAAEKAANTERTLSEEMSKRINAIGSDPAGAMQYILNGINEHPNRYDIIEQTNPKPGEVRWGQFTRDKQRRRQGVFADQPRPPRQDSPNRGRGRNQGGFGGYGQQQNSGFSNAAPPPQPNGFGNFNATYTNAFAQQPPTNFAQPVPQQQSNGFTNFGQPQQTPGVFSRDNATPFNGSPFGQSPANNAFGRPTTPFGQQQQAIPQDDAMLSPTHPTQSTQPNGFGQSGPGGFFANPQPQISTGFQNQQQANGFGQPQQQPAGFGQPQQQPNGFHQSPQMNGTPAQPQQPLEGPRAELKAAYDYGIQHGHFENGLMPETAPEEDWIA